MQHVPWTDIENFYNVRKTLAHYPHLLGESSQVSYRAKVKIHGTNAGVMINGQGQVAAMSRTMMLTSENDNAGFAKWVAEHSDEFAQLKPRDGDVVIIYGEWCGPGIQKGVAACQIPQRSFAVFALRIMSETSPEFIVEPQALKGCEQVSGCYVIPWFNHGETFNVNWHANADELESVLSSINKHVEDVERCDPWIKSVFGVEGVGEGLVFYPDRTDYKSFSDLCFKAKGKQHQVVAHTKPVQADPNVAASLQAFADMVVTPARLEQGAMAINNGMLEFDTKLIGKFLEWIGKDVIKETRAELEASKLDVKAAVKACSNKARIWYVEQTKKL